MPVGHAPVSLVSKLKAFGVLGRKWRKRPLKGALGSSAAALAFLEQVGSSPLHQSSCLSVQNYHLADCPLQASLHEMFAPALVPAAPRKLLPGRRFKQSLTLADLRADLPEQLQRSLSVKTLQDLQVRDLSSAAQGRLD